MSKRVELRAAPVPLIRLTIALPEPVLELLEQLRQLGLWGVTLEAVAERLIAQRLIERHVIVPRLRLPPPK